MYYKKYGKTGIKVSAIGMGCMRFEEKDILNKKYDNCIELILYAHEKGINYFDTAPFYCHDQSESKYHNFLLTFFHPTYTRDNRNQYNLLSILIATFPIFF